MNTTITPNIAIDISPTQNGNQFRGVGFYTSRLTDSLIKYCQTSTQYHHWHIDLVSTANTEINKYDLIHYPYFDPFELTLPQRHRTPLVVTVHDIIPRQFKSHFPVGFKGEVKWLLQKQRLQHIDRLITDSLTSKYSISTLTGVAPDKIIPIYLAADSIFQPINNQKLLSQTVKKYSLPQKFVLYVGDINWNKNIPTLVNTCRDLNYPLVIVGSSATQKHVVDHPWTQDLLWLQKQTFSQLFCLGFVPNEDLSVIYNLATVYCHPSYAEGFGLGLLEAMQSGCPTIYSQNTSLEEIAGNAGLSFNPHNPFTLKKALTSLYSDARLQEKYRHLGITRSRQFSWQKTAEQTLQVYQSILS
ncbi:glycosyltransferase family 4 protein [Patescibacteria group bacterium]|nr:glycosyltransferase family 4 protein [Patescibacteria group bacterium]